MPPVWRSQIDAHHIHHGKGLDARLSLVLAMRTIQVIEEVVNLVWQIYLEKHGDGVQELLDPHKKEMTIDELIEEQDIEELHPVQSEERIIVLEFDKEASV
ncbi:hypothetical protein TNCV_4649081 [Trichonephila clavipes]|uniref:Uncharacterized protein n=1 Tax=Trichonephila clavipes TaxID=2585209 RepID=A0A8X6SUL7_TRICX|nr:hypothetical protein TNCV_4649081 [Trichonephila clavipes]